MNMGRKKVIEDDQLMVLIQRFYREECAGNPNKLKLPEIAEYVKVSGYPGYAVESLRRNKKARIYIDDLKKVAGDTEQGILVAYKTLDIEVFLDVHKTKASLRKALTELDGYYKNVADTAVYLNQKYRNLEQKYEGALATVEELSEGKIELTQQVSLLKAEMKKLKVERDALKNIVEEYVYPDIAGELLAQAGVFRNEESVVDVERLGSKIVTGATVIEQKMESRSKSNVIQGLFCFAED